MEKEEGVRKGSAKYYHNGFYYHEKMQITTKKSEDIEYRCANYSRGCRGAAKVNSESQVVKITTIHNHKPDFNAQSVSLLKKKILEKSETAEIKPKHLFNSIVSKESLSLGSSLNYNSMRAAMQRRKNKGGLPKIPKYLLDFEQILNNTFEPTKELFRGIVEADGGSAAAIFASDLMLKLLNSDKTKRVEIDATFAVSPRDLKIYQLYTVHIENRGAEFCAVWVLMTHKKLKLYTAVWKKILELAPNLMINLTEIMSDFESAIPQSILNCISRLISIKGCWFHFCQCLLRRWKKLGLIRLKAPKKALWMAMNLALAPEKYFEEGLKLIESLCNEDIKQFKEIKLFFEYLRKQWLPLAHVVCMYDNGRRTNNAVESFHKNAFDELGGNHPNMYSFLTKMSSYIKSEDMQYLRLQKGFPIRRNVPKKYISNDAHILHCQQELVNEKMTLATFLNDVIPREQQQQFSEILEITELSAIINNPSDEKSNLSDKTTPGTSNTNDENDNTFESSENVKMNERAKRSSEKEIKKRGRPLSKSNVNKPLKKLTNKGRLSKNKKKDDKLGQAPSPKRRRRTKKN